MRVNTNLYLIYPERIQVRATAKRKPQPEGHVRLERKRFPAKRIFPFHPALGKTPTIRGFRNYCRNAFC